MITMVLWKVSRTEECKGVSLVEIYSQGYGHRKLLSPLSPPGPVFLTPQPLLHLHELVLPPLAWPVLLWWRE